MSNVELKAQVPEVTSPLNWNRPQNRPVFDNLGPVLEEKIDHSLNILITPLADNRIIIIYPGVNEDELGPNYRYEYLAHNIYKKRLGAFIRIPNAYHEGYLPITNLRKVINYTLENSVPISGSNNPELCLMGYSYGASGVATIASEYDQITRILLIAPSGDMPKELVRSQLSKFKGEVYIVIGENDEIVGYHSGEIYYNLALSARHKELIPIPNCGHYFEGKINDNIFKKAPFYAFARKGKPKFP